MIIISYHGDSHFLIGGYGDRIVGLVSCKLIAKAMNREFRIHWQKEDVSRYIDYSKYKTTDITGSNTVHCQAQHEVKHDLMTNHNCLNSSKTVFILNQEIAQYLYTNPRYNLSEVYYRDIFDVYKSLYTDILVPTPYVSDVVNNVCGKSACPIIGVQIRAGDVYIGNNGKYGSYSVFSNPSDNIRNYLSKIKNHIEQRYAVPNYRVFITSDYDDIKKIATTLWTPDHILYYDEPVQHIDRPVSGEFGKFYIDNYILSQCTNEMYISTYSNYGRVAALSALHTAVWDIDTNPVNLKKLVSKHEIIFPTD
jgi:hypothetical protein